jgi:hypothetical protein
MLIELRCDEFKNDNSVRPPIKFQNSLNVVLGSETGSNSIGKSTFLMIVDFAFGGDDYVLKSTDVQNQVKEHTIQFTFRFGVDLFFFSRNTIDHTTVKQCDENYAPTDDITLDQYREWLFDKYNITLPFTTFRDIIGRYFRIYKRDNLDEVKPLNAVKKEPEKNAIASLMKLFDCYAVIARLAEEAKKKIEEKEAYRKARDFQFVPKIGKKQITENEKRIDELQIELATLEKSSGEHLMGLDSQEMEIVAELKRRLSAVKRQKSRLSSQLIAIENEEAEEELAHHMGFDELKQFFPTVAIKTLEEIEGFHKQLAFALNSEFEEAKELLAGLISITEKEITSIEKEISNSNIPVRVSKPVLEKYSETKSNIQGLEKQNAAYNKYHDLQSAAKSMEERYKALQAEQIGFLQSAINSKMDKINDYIYIGQKRPPVLTIKNPSSYTFLTPDDTGTGTSYKGLVVFDLTVLELTALPAMVHDSVILKQIADEPLEKILELYSKSSKQIFIALDKKGSYSPRTQEILSTRTILQLSDGGNELFGRSWNVKQLEPEDKFEEDTEVPSNG